MRDTAALVVAIVIATVLAVASVAIVAPLAHHANATNGSVSTAAGANGLVLSADWNISSSSGNPFIRLNVELYNTRHLADNVTSQQQWPLNSLSSGPCSQFPAGIAIYYGSYNKANIVFARPVYWFQPGIYSCPAMFRVDYYNFLPQSDMAIMGPNQPEIAYSPMLMQFAIYQLWSAGPTGSSGHALSAGTYTLAVGDEWGQFVLISFNVA